MWSSPLFSYQDVVNGYRCECHPGFTGANCDMEVDECDPDPCVNGQCMVSMSPPCQGEQLSAPPPSSSHPSHPRPQDEVAGYGCRCDPGWTGTNCDQDIDDCDGVTCLNGGSCSVSCNGPWK